MDRPSPRAFALLAGLVTLVAAGCGASPREDASLERRLDAATRHSGIVDLRRVVPGAWDRLVVVGAYAGQPGVDDALGFHWDAGSAAPESQDEESLLLVVRGRRVVAFVDDPRVDLACLGPVVWRGHARVRARVTPQPPGPPWCRLLPASGRPRIPQPSNCN